MMNEKNEIKLKKVKSLLDKKDIFYDELPNGQLKVDSVNLWVTSEKFYDTKKGVKGQGINTFVKYLKDNNII